MRDPSLSAPCKIPSAKHQQPFGIPLLDASLSAACKVPSAKREQPFGVPLLDASLSAACKVASTKHRPSGLCSRKPTGAACKVARERPSRLTQKALGAPSRLACSRSQKKFRGRPAIPRINSPSVASSSNTHPPATAPKKSTPPPPAQDTAQTESSPTTPSSLSQSSSAPPPPRSSIPP